jgi:hypothetical protein
LIRDFQVDKDSDEEEEEDDGGRSVQDSFKRQLMLDTTCFRNEQVGEGYLYLKVDNLNKEVQSRIRSVTAKNQDSFNLSRLSRTSGAEQNPTDRLTVVEGWIRLFVVLCVRVLFLSLIYLFLRNSYYSHLIFLQRF